MYVGTLDVLNSNYASLPLWIYIMVQSSTSYEMWYIPKIVVLCTKLFNMHIAPFLLWKEIEYQIWSSQACKGFMLPLPCSWCYEWYHIVFLCRICIECMSSEPLCKMYLHGNKHFFNLNSLNLNLKIIYSTMAFRRWLAVLFKPKRIKLF